MLPSQERCWANEIQHEVGWTAEAQRGRKRKRAKGKQTIDAGLGQAQPAVLQPYLQTCCKEVTKARRRESERLVYIVPARGSHFIFWANWVEI